MTQTTSEVVGVLIAQLILMVLGSAAFFAVWNFHPPFGLPPVSYIEAVVVVTCSKLLRL